jgi:hypothetical protein
MDVSIDTTTIFQQAGLRRKTDLLVIDLAVFTPSTAVMLLTTSTCPPIVWLFEAEVTYLIRALDKLLHVQASFIYEPQSITHSAGLQGTKNTVEETRSKQRIMFPKFCTNTIKDYRHTDGQEQNKSAGYFDNLDCSLSTVAYN